mmetsp:Transcript_115617/g.360102  ORF Transcript_115617/g.360102 Transcript_115617/m.360102 type:complete len:231 (-) Transcript_115617:411-1103(-)
MNANRGCADPAWDFVKTGSGDGTTGPCPLAHVILRIALPPTADILVLFQRKITARGEVKHVAGGMLARSAGVQVREEHGEPTSDRHGRARSTCIVVDADPEVLPWGSLSCQDKLIEDGQQLRQPPLQAILLEVLRFLPNTLPVDNCALQGDARYPTANVAPVGEVLLHGIHECDVERCLRLGGGSAEHRRSMIRILADMFLDLRAEIGEQTGPSIDCLHVCHVQLGATHL